MLPGLITELELSFRAIKEHPLARHPDFGKARAGRFAGDASDGFGTVGES